MKQKLCLGDGYALTKHKLNNKIRFLSLLAVLTSMCLYAVKQVSAQQAEPAATADIKPLQIGDTIPEWLWHHPLQVVNHPEGKDTIWLNEYRDKKLLILEFWGSRCPPCIKAVDNLHRIAKDLGSGFGTLPILTLSKVDGNVKEFMKKREWTMPSVINDTVLHRIAFAKYLPDWGEVWIYEGRLLAVPKRGYTNTQAISAVMEGRGVDFVNRYNVRPIDPTSPIFKEGTSLSSFSMIGSYLPKRGLGNRVEFTQVGDTSVLYTYNRTIQQLFMDAFQREISPLFSQREAIKWEISETLRQRLLGARVYTDPMAKAIGEEKWNRSNRYGYELRAPTMAFSAALAVMQSDLNAFFSQHLGITAAIERRETYCYAVLRLKGERRKTEQSLTAASPVQKVLHTEDTWSYRNYPIDHLYNHIRSVLQQLDSAEFDKPRLIDSTGISPDFLVSFDLPKQLTKGGTMPALLTELERYGLDLTIERQPLPVLVIREQRINQI